MKFFLLYSSDSYFFLFGKQNSNVINSILSKQFNWQRKSLFSTNDGTKSEIQAKNFNIQIKLDAIRSIFGFIFTFHRMIAIIIIKFNKIHYLFIPKLKKTENGKMSVSSYITQLLLLRLFLFSLVLNGAFSHSFSFQIIFLQMHKTFFLIFIYLVICLLKFLI